jgi:CBS domain containing-hemolysin-like protein
VPEIKPVAWSKERPGVLEIAGEFPQENSSIVSGNFTFVPLEINKNRIDKIKITITPSLPVN